MSIYNRFHNTRCHLVFILDCNLNFIDLEYLSKFNTTNFSGTVFTPIKSNSKLLKKILKDLNIDIKSFNYPKDINKNKLKHKKIKNKKYQALESQTNYNEWLDLIPEPYIISSIKTAFITLLVIENIILGDKILLNILKYYRPKLIKFFYSFLSYHSRLFLKKKLNEDLYKIEYDGDYLIITDTLSK